MFIPNLYCIDVLLKISIHNIINSFTLTLMNSKYLYFAGGLLSSQDLIGKRFLSSAIKNVLGGLYECILPQDLEQRSMYPCPYFPYL